MADDAYPLPGVSSITTTAQWEAFFTAVTPSSGVVVGYANELAGSLDASGRTARIATGAAFLRGFYKPVSSLTSTAIPAASASNRVDRLVLRLDRSAGTAANFVKPTVLTGTSGSTVPPALSTSTTGSWDLPICRWTSASSGALTGLVDERQFIGKGIARCTSTNRPMNPAAGDVAFETDTTNWMGWTGSGWVALRSDSGTVTLSLNSTYWTAGSFVPTVHAINGIAYLDGSIQAKKDITGDTLICTLPSSAHPGKTTEIAAYVDGGKIVNLWAYGSGTRDGQLWAVGNAAAIPKDGFVRVNASWPVG